MQKDTRILYCPSHCDLEVCSDVLITNSFLYFMLFLLFSQSHFVATIITAPIQGQVRGQVMVCPHIIRSNICMGLNAHMRLKIITAYYAFKEDKLDITAHGTTLEMNGL